MIQREVQDDNNIRWTCVQALSGVKEVSQEKVAEVSGAGNGRVEVVCTPSGGAQTVRLILPASWLKELTDEEMLRQIKTNAG